MMKQKVLIRILLVFCIAISVPTLTIGLLAIRHSTAHIVNQVDLSSSNLLAEKRIFIEQQLSEMENLMNQIIASNEIWKLVKPFESEAEKYESMADVIRFFTRTVGANKPILSIYLINKEQNYVLADAKYSLSDFYDREAIADYPNEEMTITAPRNVVALGGLARQVVSFARPIMDFETRVKMDLIVNMNYPYFLEHLQPSDNPYHMNLLVFNDDNRIILNQTGETLDENQLDQMRSFDGTSNRQVIGNTQYYYSKTYSDSLRWTFAYIQPYTQVVGSASLLSDVLWSSLVVVLLLALLLAFLFSIYLYKPLGSLVSEIRKRTTAKTGQSFDEYSMIGAAINALFSENDSLQSRYALAYPYLKNNSVKEMLTGKVWDAEKWDGIIELLGVQFKASVYAAAVMDLESMELTDHLIGEVETFLIERASAHLLSVMNDSQLAIIVNTEMDNNGIYKMFEELLSELNRNDLEVTISVSQTYHNLNKLCLAYREAAEQLNHKFFVGKNRVIIWENTRVSDHNESMYDKRIQEELLDGIRLQNMEKSLEALRSFIETMREQSLSIGYIKYVSFHVFVKLRDSLAEVGGMLEPDMEPERMWDGIDRSGTLHELESFLQQFLRLCIDVSGDIKRKQHTELVGKTMDFIRVHYRQDLSLKDIASSVYLSTGYLSTIFKSEQGMTVLDYLTQVRMESAKELLHEPDAKIQDIAQAVGYNNVQSFIRFFKKTFKMTPAEYRRSIALSRL